MMFPLNMIRQDAFMMQTTRLSIVLANVQREQYFVSVFYVCWFCALFGIKKMKIPKQLS